MPRAKIWNTEKLVETFEASVLSEHLDQGIELLKKQKISDFIIAPGKVSAKYTDELGIQNRIEILIGTFSDEDWFTLLLRLSMESLYLAHFLCGNIPLKMESLCDELGLELFPSTLEQLELRYQGKTQKQANPAIAAVLHRLAERLREEHFLLFVLRGKNPEEIIANLRQKRRRISEKKKHEIPTRYKQLNIKKAESLESSMASFWDYGKELRELRYSIKADDLPASILKRLDPLPLGGMEEEIEFQLEEAYAQVARRAQGYGLGME